LQGRMRFALEIVRRSKEKAGKDFPLIFRISADEYLPGGLTLEETKVICRELERAGIDALHVSAGDGDESPWIKSGIMPAAVAPGCLVHFAEEIKKVVHVPIITIGRINDPRLAEKILQDGKADLVAMARALLVDPYLPQKAFKEKYEDIRKCIGCSLCPTFVLQRGGVRCAVNPSLGREKEERTLPLPKKKRVLVVGGGPAGLEAARSAALRGHSVILYEKERLLGGQLNLAAKAPYKAEMMNIIHYLSHQLKKLGVEVTLGKEVTLSSIPSTSPEALVIAAGAVPFVSEIKGVSPEKQPSTWEVLGGARIFGNQGVVLGSSSVSLEAAEVLANEGKEVVVLAENDEVALDMESRSRFLLLQRLGNMRVRILKNTQFREWRENKTIFFTKREGREETVGAEFLISSVQPLPNQILVKELEASGLTKEIDVYVIGDCLNPRSLLAAIHDGYGAGREI